MKKVLCTLLAAAALTLSSCGSKVSMAESKKALEAKSYSVSEKDADTTKTMWPGLAYGDFKLTGSLVATKGANPRAYEGVFFGLYFESSEDATGFSEAGSYKYENLTKMKEGVEQSVSEEVEVRFGTHNNVAYAGTLEAIKIAIPDIPIE